MANAIHPDYFKDFRVSVTQAEEKPIQEREEIALADLAETAGWKVLAEYIETLKTVLDTLLTSAMQNGASYEEIGQKTIVTTLTKGYLDQIIAKVEDAKAAVEQPTN